MGLFGGFKAKFTKDSTAKSSKSTRKNDVVCLGYRTHSEFDEAPQYLQQNGAVRKQPTAIKTTFPKPTLNINLNQNYISSPPSTSTEIVTNPNVRKPLKKKAPETKQTIQINGDINTKLCITNKNSSAGESSGKSKIKVNRNDERTQVEATETIIRKNEQEKKTKKEPKSILKSQSFKTEENSQVLALNTNSNNTKSILKSQSVKTEEPSQWVNKNNNTTNHSQAQLVTANHSSDYNEASLVEPVRSSQINGNVTKIVDSMTATQSVTSNHTNDTGDITDESYFSHPYYSEDDTSHNQNRFSVSYTSQAANIFFGVGEEAKVAGPNRVLNFEALKNEEDRRSSADC